MAEVSTLHSRGSEYCIFRSTTARDSNEDTGITIHLFDSQILFWNAQLCNKLKSIIETPHNWTEMLTLLEFWVWVYSGLGVLKMKAYIKNCISSNWLYLHLFQLFFYYYLLKVLLIHL